MTGRSTNFSYTFNLKNLECELCKVNLPERFTFRGKCFSFLEFPDYKPPYLIFDILRKESKKARGVHILKLNYKPNITIGRGSGNDIRMNDISVSRNHAELKLTNCGLYVEDKGSKFGTVVLVKKSLGITQHNTGISFQIGRSLINVQVKCKWKFAMKLNENNENINESYDPQVPKSALQFKFDHMTDDENIIEIADSEEESDSEEEEEEEEMEEEYEQILQNQNGNEQELIQQHLEELQLQQEEELDVNEEEEPPVIEMVNVNDQTNVHNSDLNMATNSNLGVEPTINHIEPQQIPVSQPTGIHVLNINDEEDFSVANDEGNQPPN